MCELLTSQRMADSLPCVSPDGVPTCCIKHLAPELSENTTAMLGVWKVA